jgi:predicted Zn finger-like uncharacterized protein
MNIITVCPKCRTRFIVNRAGLKANDGEVACIQCHHRFNHRLFKHGVQAHSNRSFMKEWLKNRYVVLALKLFLIECVLFLILVFCKLYLTHLLPASTPYVQRGCAIVHCRPNLPKEIRKIGLDDVEITQDASLPEYLLIKARLTNHAKYAQEFPTLILTASDSDRQQTLRRYLSPRLYLNNNALKLKEGFQAEDEVIVSLTIPINQMVSEYQLIASYSH